METSCADLHLDITIDENEINKGATEIIKKIRPYWPMDQLYFKVFTNGITNKLIGVYYPEHYNEMVLVRVYGHKTDLLINRSDEIENILVLNKVGFTHSIYATFNNGFAYEFLEGETLTVDTVRNVEIHCLIAKRMAQMHNLKPTHLEEFQESVIWGKAENFMSLMPKCFSDASKQSRFQELIRPYEVLQSEYNTLKEELTKLGSPVVYAHNDLLLTNILYNKKKNSVTFIDYEYTGYNYQAFDIANHFAEFAGVDSPDFALYPDEKFQKAWLKEYLQAYNETDNVDEKDVNKLYIHVNKFVLLAHFFWGCWALVQSQYSHIDFDFLKYAASRFNEYFHRKQNNLF
ncbi:ethanolamine kinase 1 [Prorops nasuta]|uniref:ethanolamine kinase 1 n=1 Tax=Prorops nasuta TaxID=863751 RepID=UPI0034CF5E2B